MNTLRYSVVARKIAARITPKIMAMEQLYSIGGEMRIAHRAQSFVLHRNHIGQSQYLPNLQLGLSDPQFASNSENQSTFIDAFNASWTMFGLGNTKLGGNRDGAFRLHQDTRVNISPSRPHGPGISAIRQLNQAIDAASTSQQLQPESGALEQVALESILFESQRVMLRKGYFAFKMKR